MYRRVVIPGALPRIRTTIARWLEDGVLSGSGSRLVARAHGELAAHGIARPLRVPTRAGGEPIVTIAVGGATLGGSGKTRVALACARELASLGANVVLVGHAYRATPRWARVVTPNDALADVGDEALACARELAGTPASARVRVVVGPSRQAAIDLAAALVPHVDAVVLDGPLQLSPLRASLAILALDADAPWGAGDVPPAGDLRAPREALLAHADHVAHVDATPRAALVESPRRVTELASLAASLARNEARIGLFTAIARPERLERALVRAGLVPAEVVRAADHGPVTPRLARRLADLPVDLWLTTAKCAVHLETLDLRAPRAILDGSVVLAPPIALALRDALARGRPGTAAIRSSA
ncbi:MAG: Tetraacyldisaccharide 4-kinase [Labilithrix sp.]|nr:Tetraacyldisaccharide 4-kinase [Labilithrix sp.]